ncbi:MAG: hypothetical protein IPJ98_11320 [Bryobacterales bacterium]|nr:hypothetical protein [Bryobacterales bacterium]
MSTIRTLTVGLAAAWLAVPGSAQTKPDSSPSALLAKAIESNRDPLAVSQRIDEARGLLRQAGVRACALLEVSGTTGRALGGLVGEGAVRRRYLADFGDSLKAASADLVA